MKVRIVLALAILALASLAPALGRAPVTLTPVYLALAVLAIIAYWRDKHAAEAGRRRTSEQTLHVLDLFGGIVGGLLAQALLRHKTAKPDFAAITYAIAALHLAGLLLLLFGLFNQ